VRELWIIVEREFLERVRTRSFVIGTLAFPVFVAAVFMLPMMMGDPGPGEIRLAVVDGAPDGIGEVFTQALVASPLLTMDGDPGATAGAAADGPAPDRRTYTLRRVPGREPTDALNRDVLDGALDGYVVLPDDILEGGAILYRSKNLPNPAILRDVRLAGTAAVQVRRMGAAGLDPAAVQSLLEPVELRPVRITAGGQEGGDAQGTFLVAYLLAFLAYLVIAMYGHTVMRSVIQEKTTRISEILVSSVRATHLMAGKIAGVSGAALLQIAVWAGMVALVLSQPALLVERLGASPALLEAFRLELGIGLILALFFVLGFLLYAALFAALGAAMSTEQEAQPFQMVLMLPLFVPLLFLGAITTDPDGRIATVLGLLPVTAPVAMPMRLAAAAPDPGVVAGSLTILFLTTAALAWVAGKIYRVGILATGKRPGLRELARWVRAA
jgi:ABC-2 type transport system permease protein